MLGRIEVEHALEIRMIGLDNNARLAAPGREDAADFPGEFEAAALGDLVADPQGRDLRAHALDEVVDLSPLTLRELRAARERFGEV